MASIITMKCLKIIIRNKNVLNIYIIITFLIKYMLYKNAHDRTVFIFFLNYNFLESRVRQFRHRANFAASTLLGYLLINHFFNLLVNNFLFLLLLSLLFQINLHIINRVDLFSKFLFGFLFGFAK